MMATSGRSWGWQLGLVSCLAMGGAIASLSDYALAQITPDGTLGAESSVVTPTNIDGLPTDQIDGGATRGANLFHSFEEFSIPTGGAAYFNNALDIQNIISRVTGGSISNINGLLRANGTANLFLLNPNGIIFGPNARLNIGGSFLASTASSLNFADGTQFSATASQNTPLLTVSVPIGLQYGGGMGSPLGMGGTAGSILNQSRATNSSGEVIGLQVQPGETLALVGGEVRLDGGNLQALEGRIELGGVAGAGTVGLNVDGNNLLLSFPDNVARADVYLTNSSSNTARVNVAASNAGSIAITARNIDIAGESLLRGGLEAGKGIPGAKAGDITLNATGAIAIVNSFINNDVNTGAVGKGGNITIKSGSLSVTNGARLTADTYGWGDAGSVIIDAESKVSFDGVMSDNSAAISRVQKEGRGNGGDIRITAGSLYVTNGALLIANTFGQGDAGSVTITARDTVSFDGVDRKGVSSSGAYNHTKEGATGKVGGINITTGSLFLRNGAYLSSNTSEQEDAGSVTITARDTVLFDGWGSNGFSSGIWNTTYVGSSGQGGEITINTAALRLQNGAVVNAQTLSSGEGGRVTIKASTFEAASGGQVLTTTNHSSGKAGEIIVTATDSITLSGNDPTYADRLAKFGRGKVSNYGPASGLFANTGVKSSTGEGGNIKIATEQLTIQDGAQVTVSSQGSGNAGNLKVDARSISLEARAAITATSRSGQGGNITLEVQDLLLMRRNSQISAVAGTPDAGGIGGNINIDADLIVAVPDENSDITANSFFAEGGTIDITAQGIFGLLPRSLEEIKTLLGTNDPTQLDPVYLPSSDITSISQAAPSINTPDVDPTQGLATLPAELVDASGLIATGCAAGEGNEFIVTGRGGLPPNPSDPLSSDTVWSDLRSPTKLAENRPNSEEAINPTRVSTITRIVEAQGWVINNLGEVVLTAHAPTTTLHVPWMTPAQCNAPETSS